jgi:glycine cleavage system regulatory protein
MPTAISLVFTFVGADQPGLVEKLSHTVAAHGGNWLQSRMSELAGQFAGIVEVEVASEQADDLRAALLALSAQQLSVLVAPSPGGASPAAMQTLHLSILGNDRPGIVREVAQALATRNINVREMNTSVTSAPMSGEPLVTAMAQIQVPQALDLAELKARLDTIADALTVDIDLQALPA